MVTIVFTTILHLYAILHFLQAQTIYISTVKQNGCPTCYTYTKLSQHSFLLGNNTFFRFKVKACSSAYVGLMETDSDEENMYEIAIEGEQNIGGVGIYDGKRGNSLYDVPVSGIMDCYLMKDFYVEWTNNFITVENYVPLSDTWVPILTWSSAQLYAINFIGVTTGRHQDGEWEIGNPNIPRVNAHLAETFYTTETMSFPIYTGTYFPLTIHSTVNTTEHVLSPVIPTSSSSFISTALNPSMYTISSPLFPTASNTLTYTLLSPLLSSVPSPSISKSINVHYFNSINFFCSKSINVHYFKSINSCSKSINANFVKSINGHSFWSSGAPFA
ncbi:uncharacterized protein LOC117344748 [Pecten maximus]|uniref:uncharacterized protein LOC117344748 n=1 Tax=Pecten maximus TaxID=6579 RepID=UPI001458530A|nr:uncharacterized protein LOC117344748 [Pecten maximus]